MSNLVQEIACLFFMIFLLSLDDDLGALNGAYLDRFISYRCNDLLLAFSVWPSGRGRRSLLIFALGAEGYQRAGSDWGSEHFRCFGEDVLSPLFMLGFSAIALVVCHGCMSGIIQGLHAVVDRQFVLLHQHLVCTSSVTIFHILFQVHILTVLQNRFLNLDFGQHLAHILLVFSLYLVLNFLQAMIPHIFLALGDLTQELIRLLSPIMPLLTVLVLLEDRFSDLDHVGRLRYLLNKNIHLFNKLL